MRNTLLAGIAGESSLQGFLGGAKWISFIHSRARTNANLREQSRSHWMFLGSQYTGISLRFETNNARNCPVLLVVSIPKKKQRHLRTHVRLFFACWCSVGNVGRNPGVPLKEVTSWTFSLGVISTHSLLRTSKLASNNCACWGQGLCVEASQRQTVSHQGKNQSALGFST